MLGTIRTWRPLDDKGDVLGCCDVLGDDGQFYRLRKRFLCRDQDFGKIERACALSLAAAGNPCE